MARALTPEGRAAYNAYMRDYRANHREKMAEYEARRWNKKGAEMAAQLEAQNEKCIDGNRETI